MQRTQKFLVAAGLILVAVLLVWALLPSPVPVTVIPAERGSFEEYVEEEGKTVVREPYQIAAPIGGFLQRVELEAGDPVTAGAVLFRLEAAPVPGLDRRALRQAEEMVRAAEARIRTAKGELDAREAERRQAERELARAEQLRKEAIISEADYDSAQDNLARAMAIEAAAAANVEAVRFEAERARTVLEVAQGTRADADSGRVEVRAPIDGVILRRHRESAGPVQAGEPILDIGDLAGLEVQVNLLSMDAVRLREGMRVELTRWGGGRDLTGRVRRVDPAGFTRISALGVEEQRVPVFIALDETRAVREELGDGYRVEARFILWEGEDILRVPSSALFRADHGWAVYVVEGSRAKQRAVEPGRRSGIWTQIVSGLADGEPVIAHPGDELTAGTRVEPEFRRYR